VAQRRRHFLRVPTRASIGVLKTVDKVVAVPTLSDTVRAALNAGHLAHLATLEPDGRPQVSIVWVGVQGDEIVSAHLGNHRKLDNVRRDPRVALSMETGGMDPSGLAHYLVIHGTARITEGGAPQRLQELASIYLGEGVKFPPMDDPPSGFLLHISPERVTGVGPW